ncbi:MAG: 3'-5' exonuclease, partial [Treponema sp.]|nr:3'-5' exonuclease [Treponema sp.]
ITNKMVFGQKEFKDVFPDFFDFMGNEAVIVAHNAQFDLRFINKELERIGMLPLANRAVDTLRFSRWALPENEHWTLQFLANQFGIEVKSAHRAEDDAMVCMEVFFKCIEASMEKQKSIIS